MAFDIRQTAEFAEWFSNLKDRMARARVTARIRRLSLGDFGEQRDIVPAGVLAQSIRRTAP